MTSVKFLESSGANFRHRMCVCGYPCRSRRGGPFPPLTTLIDVPLVWTVCLRNPGKKSISPLPAAHSILDRIDSSFGHPSSTGAPPLRNRFFDGAPNWPETAPLLPHLPKREKGARAAVCGLAFDNTFSLSCKKSF